MKAKKRKSENGPILGGSVNQSIIAERCQFSKAKTSQLLSALEQKGVVIRHKKGRDKIVILAQQH